MIANDPYPSFDFLTLTQLGKLFGVSAQVVGRWLYGCGLRTVSGTPVPKSIEVGIATQFHPENGNPFWVWDKERTVRLLETAGQSRSGVQPPSPPQPLHLTGPLPLVPTTAMATRSWTVRAWSPSGAGVKN